MLDKLRIFIDRVLQNLAAFGSALISPIERLVSGATGKLLSASERIDRVESLFGRLLRILFWPFRLLGSGLQLLLPAPVTRLFVSTGEKIRDLFGSLGVALLHLAEKFNLDRVVFGLVWLLQPIWRPLAAIGIFCACWLNTREYRRALMALPAMFLATLVLGVGAWHSVLGKGKIRASYKQAVRETQESRDFQLRELYDQKLAQLGEDTQLTEYRTASELAKDGKLDQAYERMKALAPEDHEGYPYAHMWIVEQLISGELVESNEESTRLAKVHLEHLKTLEVESPQLQFIEAILLSQENKLEEASAILEPLVSLIPGAAFEQMRISLVLKRRDEAQQAARAVVTHMKSRTQGEAKPSPTEYRWWLSAEEVLGNLQRMRSILEEWHESEPDNETATKLLAKVCRQQARNLLRAPLPDQQQIMELWIRAAKLDNSPDALLRLARALYNERNTTPVYSELLQALHESPNTPVALLIAMGTEIAQKQNYVEARPFFAAAVAREEQNPVAWNNYGLVLAEGQEPDLDQALLAVNKAIEYQPKEHRFRETRGQILLKMERWQEAIEDLEYALNGLPDLTEIHVSLSKAYAALGQKELAELHKMQTQ